MVRRPLKPVCMVLDAAQQSCPIGQVLLRPAPHVRQRSSRYFSASLKCGNPSAKEPAQ